MGRLNGWNSTAAEAYINKLLTTAMKTRFHKKFPEDRTSKFDVSSPTYDLHKLFILSVCEGTVGVCMVGVWVMPAQS